MTTVMDEETTAMPTGEAFYVYGIVSSATPAAALDAAAGMGGGVELVADGPVAALVEPVDPDRPLGRRRDLVAHSNVLNAMAVQGPVLPIRFGAVVDSREAVVEGLLRPQQDHFDALLREVAGKVQFTLRARYVLDTVLAEVVAAEPEVAELRRRTAGLPEDATHYDRIRLGELVARAVEERRRADAQLILDRLAGHAEDHLVREVSGMDNLAEMSFLVAEDRVAELEHAAEVLAEEYDGRARLSLVGPMALFDFIPEG